MVTLREFSLKNKPITRICVKVLVKKNPCRPTHNSNNVLGFQKKLGLKYKTPQALNSTCFVVCRQLFLLFDVKSKQRTLCSLSSLHYQILLASRKSDLLPEHRKKHLHHKLTQFAVTQEGCGVLTCNWLWDLGSLYLLRYHTYFYCTLYLYKDTHLYFIG